MYSPALSMKELTNRQWLYIDPPYKQLYRDYFEQHNVSAVIFPTTPLTARPIATELGTVELNGEQVPTFPTYIRNTDPSSNAGIPSISLPSNTLPTRPAPLGLSSTERPDRTVNYLPSRKRLNRCSLTNSVGLRQNKH